MPRESTAIWQLPQGIGKRPFTKSLRNLKVGSYSTIRFEIGSPLVGGDDLTGDIVVSLPQ